jgi:hypothetical protein
MCYYLVKWLSEPYTLQIDRGMSGMIPARTMVGNALTSSEYSVHHTAGTHHPARQRSWRQNMSGVLACICSQSM